MSEDARFADGAERPLRLVAQDEDDLRVIAALCQDAVTTGADIAWDRRRRRLDLLVNRFRWERGAGDPERVRAVLTAEGALAVASDGFARDADTVLSLLSLSFEAGEAPGGTLMLTFAGDGALRAEVEALEVRLVDVTRPYAALSGRTPDHGA